MTLRLCVLILCYNLFETLDRNARGGWMILIFRLLNYILFVVN